MQVRPTKTHQKDVEGVAKFNIFELFDPWMADKVYKPMEIVRVDSKLYQIMQGHTSQSGWLPSATPALYKEIGFTETGIPIWVQPLGAVDAYQVNAVVMFGGFKWQNTIANNVWQPGVYGWVKI